MMNLGFHFELFHLAFAASTVCPPSTPGAAFHTIPFSRTVSTSTSGSRCQQDLGVAPVPGLPCNRNTWISFAKRPCQIVVQLPRALPRARSFVVTACPSSTPGSQQITFGNDNGQPLDVQHWVSARATKSSVHFGKQFSVLGINVSSFFRDTRF